MTKTKEILSQIGANSEASRHFENVEDLKILRAVCAALSARAAELVAAALVAILDRIDGTSEEKLTAKKEKSSQENGDDRLTFKDVKTINKEFPKQCKPLIFDRKVLKRGRPPKRKINQYSNGHAKNSYYCNGTSTLSNNGNVMNKEPQIKQNIKDKKTTIAIDGSLIRLHPTFKKTMIQIMNEIAPEKEVCFKTLEFEFLNN